MKPFSSWGRLFFAVSLLAVCQASHSHGHGHCDHDHSHDAGHEHSHAHTHGGGSDDDATYGWLSKFCREWPQVSALIATAFISMSSLFVMPLLPLIDTQHRTKGGFSPEEAMKSDAVLKLMVSFAVGGLLGDVFLHLIPHAAYRLCEMPPSPLGDASVLGFPLLMGMFCFFIMEKTLNTWSENGAHGHAHGAAEPGTPTPRKRSRGRDGKRSRSPARQRKRRNSSGANASDGGWEWERVKPAAYLNWVADFCHNFCDGMALAVTFAAGSGIPTTLAVFFHEVPHNLADFAILIQNGVSKRNALLAQFVSALGAVAGCLVGLSLPDQPWLHCFVGGGFIYIATVGIIPGLVQSGSIKETLAQSLAMLIGVMMMVLVLFLEGH